MGLSLSFGDRSRKTGNQKGSLLMSCDNQDCREVREFNLEVVDVVKAQEIACAEGWLERDEGPPLGRTLRLCPKHSGKKVKAKKR